MKPAGALSAEEAKGFDFVYCVYSEKHPSSLEPNHRGSVNKLSVIKLIKDNWPWPIEWFNGKYGYFFDNYFHALAYSLKVKDEANRSRNHSATVHP